MKKTLIVVLSILLFLNMSCIRKEKVTEASEFNTYELSDGLIWNDSYNSVNQIAITDSIIWIHSEHDDNGLISAYSVSGNFIAKILGYGKGADEILELTSIRPYTENSIIIYDARKGKLLKINEIENKLMINEVCNQLYLNDDAFIFQDSKIVKLPLNSPYSYILSNINGSHIDSLSYFPPKPNGMDENTHHLACTGTMAVLNDGKHIMRTTTYDGGVDFFKIEKDKISHINRFSLFDMDYDALNLQVKVPVPNDKSRTGYSFLYATDKYFYASFTESKAEENPDGECREIHVFDVEGNPIKKLNLDKEFTAFAVERNDKVLYIVSEQNDKAIIYKYQLPLD